LHAQGGVLETERQSLLSFCGNPDPPCRRLSLGALGDCPGPRQTAETIELE
jgi:hypothetical protein